MLECIAQIADTGPAIVAGDFNDWRNRAEDPMRDAGFRDVFEISTGTPAKTFPSIRPMLRMDRIYVRGLMTHQVERLTEWSALSDHLAISARLSLPAA
jgi:endonuclease/exonuclease/phosphatase family metal-dependent hydrolase